MGERLISNLKMKVESAAGIVIDAGPAAGFAVREKAVDDIPDVRVFGRAEPAHNKVASSPVLMDGLLGGIVRIHQALFLFGSEDFGNFGKTPISPERPERRKSDNPQHPGVNSFGIKLTALSLRLVSQGKRFEYFTQRYSPSLSVVRLQAPGPARGWGF